jgi:hypothetical protein
MEQNQQMKEHEAQLFRMQIEDMDDKWKAHVDNETAAWTERLETRDSKCNQQPTKK